MKKLQIIALLLCSLNSFSQNSFILKVNKKVTLNNIPVPPPLPSFIAFFGDSFTAGPPSDGGETYAYKIASTYGIPDTVYAVGGTRVCTSTYAPVGGNKDLIDLYKIELARGYNNSMVCFAYGTNDAGVGGLVNSTWKATYKAIIDSFIVRGWPVNRILIMSAPSYGNLGAPGTSNALTRQYAQEIASELGILYYDVYETFRQTGINDLLFSSTNFHPLNKGQVIWANGFYNYLRK